MKRGITSVAAGLSTRLIVFALVGSTAAVASAQVRIVQTNAGKTNNVHIIDPATHRIVGEQGGRPAMWKPDAADATFLTKSFDYQGVRHLPGKIEHVCRFYRFDKFIRRTVTPAAIHHAQKRRRADFAGGRLARRGSSIG